MILADTVLATFKDASKKLTGYRKREFMAKVTQDYFDGSARKAESVMGWNRRSVQLGLHERRTGLRCVDNYSNPKSFVNFLLPPLGKGRVGVG